MKRTYSLVLETNNLTGGGANADQIALTLERLLLHLNHQTRPLSSLEDLVITHQGFTDNHQRRLSLAAGRTLCFVTIPHPEGYYAAKNRGFESTQADVVAFGDGDCWPEPNWLELLLQPFEADRPDRSDVVAGRTTYRGDLLGTAATTIDFLYFDSPLGKGCTLNFYANNVAFDRAVFEEHRYGRSEGIYRGNCQVLGLRLQAHGVRVRFVPEARTTHRFPDSSRELLQLRLLRGRDTVGLTPHIVDAYVPRKLRWVGQMESVALLILAVRFGFSLVAINRQDMPELHGLKRLACMAAITGISLVDVGGVLHRIFSRNAQSSSADATALSYHGDTDGLSKQAA